jgi:hypothetical protein
MKTGPDALGNAKDEFGHAKHENETRRTRYRRKSVTGAQNMKTGHDTLGTAENKSGLTTNENGTRRTRHRRKRVRERET